MNVLAFDASTEWVSVAFDDGKRVVEREEPASNAHGERIMPLIDEVLDAAGVTLARVDVIAFGAGPGAFTGVRIACGVAQGLALAQGKRVQAIGTLDAIAEQAFASHGATRVVAALDARMREIYVAALVRGSSGWQAEMPPTVIAPAALVVPPGDWCGAGNAFAAYPALAAQPAAETVYTGVWPEVRPTARAIAVLARRAGDSAAAAAADARPLYVRHRVALTIAERVAGDRL